ncbi:MAG: hypothetical protein IH951_06910 [Bacteroidetes bacterium]|nr:hypothetical protein [Bacteroidota bacterium]
MRITIILLLLLGLHVRGSFLHAQTADTDNIIVVKMIEKSASVWRFEPADITVRFGDVIRFVQEDIMPHNVEFKSFPDAAKIDEIRMGRFLLTKGDVYEIKVDERFEIGLYNYICTPHASLGMVGTITVGDSVTPVVTP